jgi:hypothetical protein
MPDRAARRTIGFQVVRRLESGSADEFCLSRLRLGKKERRLKREYPAKVSSIQI